MPFKKKAPPPLGPFPDDASSAGDGAEATAMPPMLWMLLAMIPPPAPAANTADKLGDLEWWGFGTADVCGETEERRGGAEMPKKESPIPMPIGTVAALVRSWWADTGSPAKCLFRRLEVSIAATADSLPAASLWFWAETSR